MRIIITRHGETEENKAGIAQGHLPGKLSLEGIEQAKKLALRLKDEKIDYIFSSDLARAADTTQEIARYHRGIPIEYTTLLRELHMGSWQGKTSEEIAKINTQGKTIADDAESRESIEIRVRNLLTLLRKYHANKTVLLIGHAGINKFFLSYVLNAPREKIAHPQNTSVTILEITKEGIPTVQVMNCTKHLG